MIFLYLVVVFVLIKLVRDQVKAIRELKKLLAKSKEPNKDA
jgi:hypothetical protein